MTPHETKERHVELHHSLDELIACYFNQTMKRATNTTLMEFMKWSHQMTIKPTCATVEKEDEVGS